MKHTIRYNGEVIAKCKYWYEANLIYQDLIRRGKLTERSFPFVILHVDGEKVEQAYSTQAELSAMIREYGM